MSEGERGGQRGGVEGEGGVPVGGRGRVQAGEFEGQRAVGQEGGEPLGGLVSLQRGRGRGLEGPGGPWLRVLVSDIGEAVEFVGRLEGERGRVLSGRGGVLSERGRGGRGRGVGVVEMPREGVRWHGLSALGAENQRVGAGDRR